MTAVFACAALSACGVLATEFGIGYFRFLSRVNSTLTRLPIGVCGLALFVYGCYILLTKGYNYHRGIIGNLDGACLLLGSFLFLWVFNFYGRQKSGQKTLIKVLQ
jgi:hypothetical protein